MAYQPELDGIRGIAILLVLADHFLVPGSSAGQAGVVLFFVLSGYLITSLLRLEHGHTGGIDLRRFYVRRFRRLAPALLVMVAVAVALRIPGNPLPALTYATNWYIQVFGGGPDMGYLIHSWTLGLEEQFYLVWPVVFVFAGTRRVPFLIAALTLSWLAEPVLVSDAIIAGCLLAFAPRLPRWAGAVGWVALAVMVVALPQPFVRWEWIALTAAAAPIVGASLGPTWRSLTRTGQISYGLYLWNYPVAYLVLPLLASSLIVRLEGAAVGIGLTFAIALISERFIERPFRSGIERPKRDPVASPPTFQPQTHAAVVIERPDPRPALGTPATASHLD